MKKILNVLPVLLLAVFMSACSPTEEKTTETFVTYRSDLIVRADAGNGEVTMEWLMDVEPFFGKLNAKHYNIYYLQSDSEPKHDDMKNNGTRIGGVLSAPRKITGLQNGKRYWFSVSGVNFNDPPVESALAKPTSAVPQATPPPPAPEDVRANAGDQKVTVTWKPVVGAVYYHLYCYWFEQGTNVGVGKILITDPTQNEQEVRDDTIEWLIGDVALRSIQNERRYYFYLHADDNRTPDNTNDPEGLSSASFTVSAIPSADPPPFAPEIISVETGLFSGSNNVKIKWNPVDADPAVTDYGIYIGPAKGVRKTFKDGLSLVGAGSPYEAVASLGNGTWYIVMTAFNENGESAESGEWWVTLLGGSGGSSGSITIYAH